MKILIKVVNVYTSYHFEQEVFIIADNKTTAANENTELKRGIKGWHVAFLVVGVIVYGTMVSYAELLVNFPRTGSFEETILIWNCMRKKTTNLLTISL